MQTKLYFFDTDDYENQRVMTSAEAVQMLKPVRYTETEDADGCGLLNIVTQVSAVGVYEPSPNFTADDFLMERVWSPIQQAVVAPAGWNIKDKYIVEHNGVRFVSYNVWMMYAMRLNEDVSPIFASTFA